MELFKIYCDGGSRGNPGQSGCGGVIFDQSGQIFSEISQFIGIQTNNYAEYYSLILILKRAIELDIQNVLVHMDSLLVVNQINGNWKINNKNLKNLHETVKELISKFEKFEIIHIPRSLNKHADLLANKAMDSFQGKKSK